jgi:hypothetical protein
MLVLRDIILTGIVGVRFRLGLSMRRMSLAASLAEIILVHNYVCFSFDSCATISLSPALERSCGTNGGRCVRLEVGQGHIHTHCCGSPSHSSGADTALVLILAKQYAIITNN